MNLYIHNLLYCVAHSLMSFIRDVILSVVHAELYILFCSCGRAQFEEMCADILVRVEPPLRSLLEQARK